MSCLFKDTLHYSSPANGDRGIVRAGMLVPDSVELFVCPFACGRHGSISAVKENLKHRLFYLFVEQEDIVNGYDDLIVTAVGDLLETIEYRPKVLMVFVSCLDDLVGTDHEALMETLTGLYPDIKFRSCHMNPIAKGSKCPPAISIQNNIYGLLDTREEMDNGINCIGSFVPISKDSELNMILKKHGFGEMRHIANYKTFEEYQNMGKSCCNMLITPVGKQAVEQMEEKHGTPYIYIPISYRIEKIESDYVKLEAFLEEVKNENKDKINMFAADYDDVETLELTLSRYKKEALEAVERAKTAVGDTPIIVDYSAARSPFGLARALLEYGFNVIRIQAPECIGIDKENLDWILEHNPQVEVLPSQHHKVVRRENQMPESISIGIDGAYIAGSKYVVDQFDDEGSFGFHGVTVLMNKLAHALEEEVDLKSMIHEYGLVV